MQAKGTATHHALCCQIIDIGSRGSREPGKLQARARGIDDRFCSLDQRSQRDILSHMIGYLGAAKDLVSAGRQAQPNEISRTFGVMEDMVNEAWKGGVI